MTGFLLGLLRHHFADPANIDDELIREKMLRSGGYNADYKQTGIVIESVGAWRPETTEFRPAIIIKPNQWQLQQIALGDEALGGHNEDAIRHFAAMWACSHTIFALARETNEVERLGAEIASYLVYFSPIIRSSLNLPQFRLIGMDALGQIVAGGAAYEATESYVVPMSVAYAVQETWSLAQHAPKIKKIDLQFE